MGHQDRWQTSFERNLVLMSAHLVMPGLKSLTDRFEIKVGGKNFPFEKAKEIAVLSSKAFS